ncbi:hypothetical protein SAMN05216389_101357 [Oceanobacillus limi]|uniref:PhoD-like phosphatase n=1 Tax=Oceanobacillus limi TaxID=930131 RepID=A0A1H9YER1_9BACI|nr:hypothetical protein [Oceanobacillus limi]SES67431.1 hypothetical protein SAMN05216389_101357 [Oceanobacillus limi]
MKEIPFLLAGPIIRRVQSDSVYLWLATSKETTIQVELNHIQEDNGSIEYDPVVVHSNTKSLRAGKNLYIHLIEIYPPYSSFPVDVLLGYNLHFKTNHHAFDLGELGLLHRENPDSIVYGSLKYPSFFIQKNSPANILYGSCQKTHGKGNTVLTSADLTIQNHYLQTNKRPSALFLMGDQIYADDVPDPIFPVISNLADNIIGENKAKIGAIEPKLQEEPFRHAIDQIHGRQYIMDQFAGFTSSNASNHMIRFSEYAVLYLLTLGPALWEDTDIPDFDEILEEDQLYFKYPDTKNHRKNHRKEWKQHRKRYHEQLDEVIPFIYSLGQTRRILANTPTYMIFDDHDITDDWNISAEWKHIVYHSSLGKNVVANGLTAYWLFQGWGNDPVVYQRLYQEMNDYLDYYLRYSYFPDHWETRIWDFHNWTFVAPTNPRSLFLDTRTMRAYDMEPQPIRIGRIIGEGKNAAQLIGEAGWKVTDNVLQHSTWSHGEPLILVSPTPLYGIGIIESFLNRFIYPFRVLGIPTDYELDFEAWKYNGKGFHQFLEHIGKWNPSPCVILSGDVHYAGAVESNVTFSDQRKVQIQQYTSSPIHNMSFSGVWGKLLKLAVWFNGFKRKRRIIHRCCDIAHNLTTGKRNVSKVSDHRWREEIKYISSMKGSIIETKNNIGYLAYDQNGISNKLLQFNGIQTEEVTYKRMVTKQHKQEKKQVATEK